MIVSGVPASPAGHSPSAPPDGVLLFAADIASRSEQAPSLPTSSVVMLGWMTAAFAGTASVSQSSPTTIHAEDRPGTS
jgi:hypothetical protein